MPRGIRGAQIADGTIQGVDIEDGSLTFADFDSNEINWKEPVANEAALPATNNVVGDARVAMAEVTLHLWDGTAWKAFATSSYSTSSFNADLATKTTDDVTEGTTNKYFYTHDHNDLYYTETETDTLLNSKALTIHSHDDLYYTEGEADTLLSSKAPTVHSHDDLYYTEGEADTLLSSKAPTVHSHDANYFLKTEISTNYYDKTATNTLLDTKAITTHIHDDIYYTETEADARFLGINAQAANSQQLDGLDSSQFIRSDISDIISGSITLNNSTVDSPNLGFSTLGYDDVYVDGSTGRLRFVSANLAAAMGQFEVNGDFTIVNNASVGGDVTIGDGTDSVKVAIVKATDNGQAIFRFNSASGSRWSIRKQGTEAGSNSGSDLLFGCYDDNNVWINNPLTLRRDTSNAEFIADVIIGGNLTVSGTTTTVNTETLNLADNIIVINSNETGTPSQDGGIEIERGTGTNYQFLFEESSDAFKIGEIGSLQSVATREDTPTDGGIAVWDTTTNKFNTTLIAPNSDKLDGISSSQFLRSDATDTASAVVSFGAGINMYKYISLLDYDDVYGSNTGIRSYVRDGVWEVGKATSETNSISIEIEGNKVLTDATGLTLDTTQTIAGTKTFSNSLYTSHIWVDGNLFSNVNVLDINANMDTTTESAYVRVNRSTNTTGISGLQVMKGDNTATVVWSLDNAGGLAAFGKNALKTSDAWLRINDGSAFTSGIYCGNSVLRTDGNLIVGNGGESFKANSTEVSSGNGFTTGNYKIVHNSADDSLDFNYIG